MLAINLDFCGQEAYFTAKSVITYNILTKNGLLNCRPFLLLVLSTKLFIQLLVEIVQINISPLYKGLFNFIGSHI